jgi:hypothetical protein
MTVTVPRVVVVAGVGSDENSKFKIENSKFASGASYRMYLLWTMCSTYLSVWMP